MLCCLYLICANNQISICCGLEYHNVLLQAEREPHKHVLCYDFIYDLSANQFLTILNQYALLHVLFVFCVFSLFCFIRIYFLLVICCESRTHRYIYFIYWIDVISCFVFDRCFRCRRYLDISFGFLIKNKNEFACACIIRVYVFDNLLEQ